MMAAHMAFRVTPTPESGGTGEAYVCLFCALNVDTDMETEQLEVPSLADAGRLACEVCGSPINFDLTEPGE